MDRYSKTLLRTGAAKKQGVSPHVRPRGEMTREEEATLLGEPLPDSPPAQARNSDGLKKSEAVLPLP